MFHNFDKQQGQFRRARSQLFIIIFFLLKIITQNDHCRGNMILQRKKSGMCLRKCIGVWAHSCMLLFMNVHIYLYNNHIFVPYIHVYTVHINVIFHVPKEYSILFHRKNPPYDLTFYVTHLQGQYMYYYRNRNIYILLKEEIDFIEPQLL